MSASQQGGTARPQLRVVSGARRPSEHDDAELIRAVQEGDDRVAGALYSHLIGTVERSLYRVFGRREQDHDDLVQMAFEQIVLTLSRQSFAGGCSLKTWAAAITSRVGWKVLRSRRRERQVVDRRHELLDGNVAATADVEGDAGTNRALEQMRQHMSSMRPLQAEALFLHDVLGHELAEIAHMTGVSVAAAQSRLVRGRRELVKRMQQSGFGVRGGVG